VAKKGSLLYLPDEPNNNKSEFVTRHLNKQGISLRDEIFLVNKDSNSFAEDALMSDIAHKFGHLVMFYSKGNIIERHWLAFDKAAGQAPASDSVMPLKPISNLAVLNIMGLSWRSGFDIVFWW